MRRKVKRVSKKRKRSEKAVKNRLKKNAKKKVTVNATKKEYEYSVSWNGNFDVWISKKVAIKKGDYDWDKIDDVIDKMIVKVEREVNRNKKKFGTSNYELVEFSIPGTDFGSEPLDEEKKGKELFGVAVYGSITFKSKQKLNPSKIEDVARAIANKIEKFVERKFKEAGTSITYVEY